MTAYNKVNGIYAGEHPWLFRQVLREEWGFTGLVVSDWGAVHDRIASLAAGLDLQMPQDSADRVAQSVAAVANGSLALEHLDRAARAVLEVMARTPGESDAVARAAGFEDHDALAVRAAAAGTVLLSNDGVPPLSSPLTPALALIGAFADEPRFQGSGSSRVTPTKVRSIRQSIQEHLSGSTAIRSEPGYPRHERHADPALIARAAEAAAECGTAIVVVGLPEWAESEGVDRAHLQLPEAHNELVERVLAVCPRTVVIVVAGSPVELPWRDRVSALLFGYLGGQAAGEALAGVLVGRLEPGGLLAETMPMSLSDSPAHRLPRGPMQAEYRESIFVGYRYADAAGAAVAFPFGHGLSYATFDWGFPRVAPGVVTGGDVEGEPFELCLTVGNTSTRLGSEVVQVYAAKVDGGVPRAPRCSPDGPRCSSLRGSPRTVEFCSPAGPLPIGISRVPASSSKTGSGSCGWHGRVATSSTELPWPRRVVRHGPRGTARHTGSGRGNCRHEAISSVSLDGPYRPTSRRGQGSSP